jgi:DNA-binding Lrp family transcriptional regulator
LLLSSISLFLRRGIVLPAEHAKSHKLGLAKAPRLSDIDKKILRALLSSAGAVSSATLSDELGIPLSTVQRRRRRLESHLVDKSYTLRAESFGMRTAELFISTKNGSTSAVANKLLALGAMVDSVVRVIGDNCTNIILDVRFRTNPELLRVIEQIRSFNGVVAVSWIERIGVEGQNSEIWQGIINDHYFEPDALPQNSNPVNIPE